MTQTNNVPDAVKYCLDSAIDAVVMQKESYVRNPSSDFTRERKISMKEAIKLIISMEGGCLHKEMHKYEEFSGTRVSASAFVQQRSKILPSALREVFNSFNKKSSDNETYRGYHLLAADGSDVNQYRNPNADTFVINPSCPHGYNQTHLNVLYDLLNKTYIDVELQPRPTANEHTAFVKMIRRDLYPPNSIIMADRGYESYNVIAHLLKKSTDFLIRIKAGPGAMCQVKKLPMTDCDCDITTEITTTQTKEDKAKGRCYVQAGNKEREKYSAKTRIRQWDFPSPYLLKFRVVRFLLDSGEYETVATSLPRSQFPPEEIKKLYHMRWGIETSFRELKYNIGLINLHCKKDELIEQEIYASLIMYNFCSRIAANVSNFSKKEGKHKYKINFAMAIYLCRRFYRNRKLSATTLICELLHYIEPIRPNRRDERRISTKRFNGFTYRVAA